jgi:hypothetical protein
MIERDMLDRLRSITARTGLSTSEQIRQGVRWWLEAWEWPVKRERPTGTAPEGWRLRGASMERTAQKRR